MEKRKIKDKKLPVGLTFSFPCQQSKIDEVRTFWDCWAPQKLQSGKANEHVFPLAVTLVIYIFFEMNLCICDSQVERPFIKLK